MADTEARQPLAKGDGHAPSPRQPGVSTVAWTNISDPGATTEVLTMRTSSRDLRRLFAWLMLGFQVALTAGAVAIRLTAPSACSGTHQLMRTGGCEVQAVALQSVTTTKILVEIVYMFILYWTHFWRVVHEEASARPDSCSAGFLRWLKIIPRAYPGSWTLAASPEMLMATCRVLQGEIRLLFFFFSVASWTLALSPFFSGLSKAQSATLTRICGPAPTGLCFFSYSVMWPLLYLVLGLGMMTCVISFGTPRAVWGPVVQRAVRKIASGRSGIRILILIPWLIIPGFAAATFMTIFAINAEYNIHSAPPSGAAMMIQTVISIAETLYIIAMVTGALVPNSLAVLGLAMDQEQQQQQQEVGWPLRETTRPSRRRWAKQLRLMWRRIRGMVWCVEASAERRRTVFLYLSQFFWALSPTDRATAVVLWVMRTVSFVAVMATRDVVIGFPRLKKHPDAGFGLVINSRHMAAALEHACAKGGPRYTGPLDTYKASMWRMPNTLAVSYRWQVAGTGTILKDGVRPLNMSQWQMGTLASVLRSSSATYVWIDCLSVPQVSGKLQQTLLARMMATYASAGAGTVVLRSLEEEGERYHQRAWTLQEFCTSRALTVHTEPAEGVHEGSGPISLGGRAAQGDESLVRRSSTTQDEESMLLSFRQWHQDCIQDCVPYWICKNDEGCLDDALVLTPIVEKYKTLSKIVNCSMEGDKLRALFPLVGSTLMCCCHSTEVWLPRSGNASCESFVRDAEQTTVPLKHDYRASL